MAGFDDTLPTVIQQFADELAAIGFGEPVTWRNATFVPLVWTTERHVDLVLIEEEHRVDIEELGEREASVPVIKIRNRSDKLVLVTDGTLVKGAYQNRVINVTFLAAPKSEKEVPVSCIEAGRWGGRGLRFKPAHKAPPKLRARARREMQEYRRWSGGQIGTPDQGRVWEDVAYYLQALHLHSPTSDLMEAVDHVEEDLNREGSLKDLIAELNRGGDGRTAGVATLWGDRVAAVDLFALPRMFQKSIRGILTAYLFDLVTAEPPKRKRGESPTSQELVRRFLSELPRLASPRKPSIGVGDELEIEGAECTGNAVLYDGKLCHMSVFGVT